MTQNEHVYEICCRPEVVGDGISGENVKTIEGYAVLNFEVASSSSFQYIYFKKTRSTPHCWVRQNAVPLDLKISVNIRDQIIDSLPDSPVLHTFMLYVIAFCSELEAGYDVISGEFARP